VTPDGPYTDAFFADVERTSVSSARRVVPVAVAGWRPASVIDVGCGEGIWAAVFEAEGVPAVGVDGEYVRPERRLVDRFVVWDLSQPLPALGRYDLAVCLEVAEHLPASSAAAFVAGLAGLADRILFSAAVPGQGGTDHINEQPHEYWIERFVAAGFQGDVAWREQFAADEDVAWWYRQNMIVFTRRASRNMVVPKGLRGRWWRRAWHDT
jgi:Methyltransferase domain